MTSKITSWVMAILAMALIIFDVFAAAAGYDYTITAITRTASKAAPIIPFAIGFLMGYWFTRAYYNDNRNK